MLFTGAYELTIDDKKRLSVPAAIRSNMDSKSDGDGFYLVLGDHPGTLALFGNQYFVRYADRLASEMPPGAEQQTFEKVFYSKCAELSIDKQGRVALPDHMLDAVGLQRHVYLTGARDHLDLWNKDDYERFIRENQNRIMELQNKARQGMPSATRG
jgi:MraZ protein